MCSARDGHVRWCTCGVADQAKAQKANAAAGDKMRWCGVVADQAKAAVGDHARWCGVADQAKAAATVPAGDTMIVCQICCGGVAVAIGGLLGAR